MQIVPSSYTILTGPGGPRRAANRYPVYLHKQELDELLSLNVSITVGHAVAYRDIYPNIPAGTKFEDLPDDWRCPRCNTMK